MDIKAVAMYDSSSSLKTCMKLHNPPPPLGQAPPALSLPIIETAVLNGRQLMPNFTTITLPDIKTMV
jgi:hypothetical protein